MKKGQILVLILILMAIALGIGMSVSSNYISSMKNIGKTDNSSRAYMAAEAGIERMLALPLETLEDYVDNGDCGEVCSWQFEFSNGSIAETDITLTYSGDIGSQFSTYITESNTGEVDLQDFPGGSTLKVCWNDPASIYASYVYYQGQTTYSKIYAYNPIDYTGDTNGFSTANSESGFDSCFDITSETTSLVLRLKPFYSNATVYVISAEGLDIPVQGVVIKSVGKFLDATRTVEVLRSQAKMTSVFDYTIYQKSETEALSNR